MEITGHTALYCLLGSPVAHSASPALHNAAFEELGIDARYLAFDVDENTLPAAVAGLRALGASGWNVTMPCKSAMARLCDELTGVARLTETVNTVLNRDGRLIGTSTDGVGLVRAAKETGFDVRGKRMVVLGAGGAGKSVIAQCAAEGAAALDIFCRRSASWEKNKVFLRHVGEETECKVELHDIDDEAMLRTCIAASNLLLNATSVGMGDGGCLVPDAAFFSPELTVADLIYEPRETPLLRLAREAGLRTFNGTAMLLWQGAAAFELWTGRRMPVEMIKKKLTAQ